MISKSLDISYIVEVTCVDEDGWRGTLLHSVLSIYNGTVDSCGHPMDNPRRTEGGRDFHIPSHH